MVRLNDVFRVVFLAVLPSATLQEHAGSDKSWVWHASDFSDGELKEELFCIRFGNIESTSMSCTCVAAVAYEIASCRLPFLFHTVAV